MAIETDTMGGSPPKRLEAQLQPAGEDEGQKLKGPEARDAEAGSPPADLPEGAHRSLALRAPSPSEVERVFRSYWLPLLSEGGKISIERLKGELFDSWHLVNEARRVYRHVTGGVTDDLTASADGIIAMADRRQDERAEGFRNTIRDLEAENRLLRDRIQRLNGGVHGS